MDHGSATRLGITCGRAVRTPQNRAFSRGHRVDDIFAPHKTAWRKPETGARAAAPDRALRPGTSATVAADCRAW